MPCELCGGGDEWIKTSRTTEGTRLLVCDQCYEENSSVLVIVPGDWTVTARCDHCGRYGNPRDFAKLSPGGRKNAFSGTCKVCAGQIEDGVKQTSPEEGLLNSGLPSGTC
jgi:hypothetical protein